MAHRQCGCFWPSDSTDMIEEEMGRVFVSEGGLRGPTALAAEASHLMALDSAMTLRARRTAGSGKRKTRVSWNSGLPTFVDERVLDFDGPFLQRGMSAAGAR
eukprot:5903601-Pyramimonas_sp.AAC.1